ncbi:MAG TPA: tripartite tricarboxylate transporter permease [Subdoligranulum variabile]|uniref:Tripartite tricarboxylate transporter permease n=1 Tax=Subdoligranulum variabile TaxID=214851 RepID=A0A921IJ67_9FIRM|nr:tripartite tricarboxylate transporter permease [Subdoligranulum variabile]
MTDFAQIAQAIPQVFTLYNMALILGGLVLGMVVGCIPGLSVTLGIILMLPLTYTFDDPASAIILLLAVYVGGMYGGSISAITLNTPGTNSAIATTFDGYPLAKKGKVKKALDTSLFASVFGGLFSAILLLVCASLITKLVANFTSVEYFSMGILGISLIAGVSGDSLPKSIISGMIGLLMACIGMDAVTGVTRFSFGLDTLKYGIDMLPAMIALLTLGIPGDGVTALLLGAFVLHGIQPGPTMFTKQGVMAYTIIIGCLVANVLLAPLGLGMTRAVAKIVQVKYTYLAPVIIMFCFAGAYAATGNTKELILCAAILIFSYILTLLDISNTPLMLGMILEDIMEQNFVTAAMSYDRNYSIFFTRPISAAILIITVVLLVSMMRLNKKIEALNAKQMENIAAGHAADDAAAAQQA